MFRLGPRLLCWTALFVGVAVSPSTVQANSVNIFNTFGPNHSSDCCFGFIVQRLPNAPNAPMDTIAFAFTPNMTTPLFAIDVAIGFGLTPGAQFTLALVTDNGGQPGSLLESWSLSATFPGVGPVCTHCFETALSIQNPVLQAGTQYWVVASPGPEFDAKWAGNNVGALGTSAFSLDEGKTWTVTTNGNFAAFDVRGLTSVPEPSTLALLGTGLLGIAGASRRKLRTGFRNLLHTARGRYQSAADWQH